MSRSYASKVAAASILAATAVFGFQNCQGFNTSMSSFSSEQGDTPIDHPIGPFVEQTKIEATSQPILADRRYINELFTEIFGARYDQLDRDRIRTNPEEFGNPCSVYEDYRVRNSAGALVRANPESACALTDAPETQRAPIFPQATAARSGMLVQLCHDLSLDPIALNNALAHFNAGPVPQVTDENVLKAFRLFYRIQPQPRPEVLNALKATLPLTAVTASDWAPLIYSLCTSSEWQVL